MVRQVGQITLTVDEHGQATLSGNAGRLSFSGQGVLREIGVNAGVFRAMMSVNESGELRFNARVRVGMASVSASGTVDVESWSLLALEYFVDPAKVKT